ncbi:MAG: metal-dependent hydrolase [Nitrospirota bacterium]
MAVSVAAGVALAPKNVPTNFWPVAIACSIIPDIDSFGLAFGIPYNHFFGHRGFFHSPFFALLMSIILLFVFFRDIEIFSRQWFFYFIFFFLLSASHGILDAFTNGGLGIPLLFPFDNKRYFFPWTPIMVSPIGIKGFFSKWGLTVIKSEILWIWFPSFLIIIVSRVIRAMAERP